ncbi:E3 ubiquitin-protein ligase RBBP6-like isoform X2 [Trachinotus anak]|uniref:E3 ubiquitin-protein ligase RBBP6-like isoform X2 n=1 Tax=Trachinotus anak TaxID=443729 RepID=UPI0039F1AF69
MTHVHYKFSSKLSYDTVVFDGPHITLTDLKRQIMGREKLRAGDCDLQITNAQTKEEYTDDEGLIPKGSSVIVRRVPISGGRSSSSSKTQNIERPDVQLHHTFTAFKAMDGQTSSSALPFFAKMANLADADVSEEDKIKVMLNQSTYDSMNYNKKFGNVLPANYTCYRCGNTGHHIRNCPTSGDKNFEAPLRIKKSTGIPRSFMVEVDGPNIKGAMLTNCGRYAIPAIDAEAYAIGKKEKPPFVPQEQPKSAEVDEDPVPDELLCLICHDLLSDAVVIPCCGNSYCDDCIRTTLLDSEEHMCPTCSQSNVSPDTLIANKFLRQAVNNFKKERGYNKSLTRRCGTSQSQNPTRTPSPVPTPPPLTVQSQSQKPHQSTYSQQDSLLHLPQAADTPALSVNPPATTGTASACNTPSTSLQTEQNSLEIPDKEAEEDSAAAAAAAATTPSVLVSNKESTAPSQLIPVVNLATLAEQPQTVSVNQQQPSLGPAPAHSGPSTSWSGSSSSSGCPTGGWTESQRLTSSSSSSSYSATPPSLFPSPLFHTYLSAHPSHSSYPPGYPPTTPIWTLPCPQGAPIPSLCSSTSTSSIPALIPKEWYRHQRKKKERSPHRGSAYRRSSSRSNSKSSKSKSSRSYSRSSSRSRSRSRSRSHGRSRPRSPYSRHRDLPTRSQPSHSYSYGYKRPRSHTPSSSSSPQIGYHSRSKSPSDHRKNRHHSRHHTKKSALSSYSSRKRGDCSEKKEESSGASSATSLYAHHANQTNSLELERERYLQWKKEYKEWCEKYFSSYVSHFQQLPPPFISLPPPPPQWEASKNPSHSNSDSRCGPTDQMDGRSPPSQSSSDIHSPSSQSSSDSSSTPSQSSSDSRSSPSHTSSDSRSPPSRSSSDGRSTPSEDGAQPRAYQQKKDSNLPTTLAKGSKEMELQENSKNDKQVILQNLKDLSTLKHEPRRIKKHEKGRGEESSSPDATDSTDDRRKDEKGHNTGPHACKDGTSLQDEAAAGNTLKSVQPSLKSDKSLDKECESKSREQRNLEAEKGWRRGKDSDSRQDVERHHKVKPSKEADRVDSERYNNPGGSRAPDSRSEKNRKRKGENLERNETHKSESPNPFDSKKQKTETKKERKTWPVTERSPLWEGGITVKPQKKISININLDGKRKEEKTANQESIVGKSKDETESTGDGEEENLNRDVEVKEKMESVREKEGVFKEKIKPDERETRQLWETATFRDDKREMWEKIAGEKEGREKKEDGEEEDFHLWHYALRAVKEEMTESEKQWEGDGKKASKGEEVTRDETGKEEEEERVRKERRGQEMGELVQKYLRERAKGESTCKENKGNPPGDMKPKEVLMEGVKRGMREEEEKDMMRFMSQRSSAESHHDRANSYMDDGSGCEDCEERRTVVKTLEEYSQGTAAEREDQLVLIQVPHSKWEMDQSEEEEQNEGGITIQDPLPVVLPPPFVTTANRETEGESELKRQRSVDRERDRERVIQRGGDREKEKNFTLSSLDVGMAPSSGKERTDSTLCSERHRERRTETERWRDSQRERESERPRDRHKESKRSKERAKEEERGRDRGREREHSSFVIGHVSSYSTYQDTERRDRQRGEQDHEKRSNSLRPDGKFSSSGSRERGSVSRAAVLPHKHTHKTYGDMSLDSKGKDRNHPHHYQNHRDPSGNYRHQGRPAGTHHSSLYHSHSHSKEREPPPSQSSSPKTSKPRMSSPGEELLQSRSRTESKVERHEWKSNKVDKVIGSHWQDKADKLAGETKWQGGKELEEGERPSSGSRSSSVGSSASQESSKDDMRKEQKKKQKHHKKEKSQASPELLEEWELKKHKHKKSKRNKDGMEEESGGEVDNRWEKEEDHIKLFSVMLS